MKVSGSKFSIGFRMKSEMEHVIATRIPWQVVATIPVADSSQ